MAENEHEELEDTPREEADAGITTEPGDAAVAAPVPDDQTESAPPDAETGENTETGQNTETGETAAEVAEDAETTDAAEVAEAAETTYVAEVAGASETAEETEIAEGVEEKKPTAAKTRRKKAAPKAEPAEGEKAEDTGPPKKWYVVHTYSGHENKVRENIQKMINVSPIKDHFGQIVVPTEEVAEMRKGKKTVTTRKFFPSYILIEMHLVDESRHLVTDIPGVTGFVGSATGPQPLAKIEVERILGRMDKEKQTIIPEIPFTLGEHIRIKDGPFSDFTGIIDEINAERGKLKVLVSIFGRETPVELDFLQVESI